MALEDVIGCGVGRRCRVGAVAIVAVAVCLVVLAATDGADGTDGAANVARQSPHAGTFFPPPESLGLARTQVAEAHHQYRTIPLPAVVLGQDRSRRQQAAARTKPAPFVTPLDGEDPEEAAAANVRGRAPRGGAGGVDRAAPTRRRGHVRAWVDCGARGLHASATVWFLRRNPKASTFHAVLFDPIDRGAEYDAPTRRLFRSFEYHPVAVAAAGISNESAGVDDALSSKSNPAAIRFRIRVEGRRMMAPVPVVAATAAGAAGVSNSNSSAENGAHWVPAVDLAAWLRARYTPADFVVLKMDIEGGEWEVLAHLVETGAIALVDELMLECHRPDPAWAIMKTFWEPQRVDGDSFDNTKGQRGADTVGVPVTTCGALFAFLGQLGRAHLPQASFLRRVHRWA